MTLLEIHKLKNLNQIENLVFCPTGQLIQLLGFRQFFIPFRSEMTSELLVRRYLNPRSVSSDQLDLILPHKDWSAMESLLYGRTNCTADDLSSVLWRTEDPFSAACEKAVRRKLVRLFSPDQTCGFIPVYNTATSQAFFVPFHFEEPSVQAGIVDLNGEMIPEWRKYYDLPYQCVVHCYQSGLPLPLTGNSFMLPVYLGAKRKYDPDFPKYDRLRLLSTGAIESGHLKSVATQEKALAAKQIFADSILLFPESGQYFAESSREYPLSVTSSIDSVMQRVCRIIEANSLVDPDFTYAMKRLVRIETETRHENFNRWSELLGILENNRRAISCWKSREGYLLGLMLKSAVLCHMGRTAEALKANQEAREYAEQQKFEKQLLRLEVEELVLFQDLEKFDVIQKLCGKLGQSIEKSGDNDLKMRYYGTMGQSHAFGSLAGLDGFSQEQSLNCFRKAAEYAASVSGEDLAQDLNYLHLYSVLFAPDKQSEQQAFEDAENHIQCDMKTCSPQVREKNRRFLHRQRAFAAYRAVLRNDLDFMDLESVRRLRLPQPPVGEEDWLFAVTDKYIGAVSAAFGDKAAAESDFADALAFLPNRYGNSILAFIRMTIFAEAFRSLGKEEYRRDGLEAVAGLKQTYPEPSCKKWEDYLNGKTPFPGLQYWY